MITDSGLRKQVFIKLKRKKKKKKRYSQAFHRTCREAKACISVICTRTMSYVSEHFVHLLEYKNREKDGRVS